jgi:quercetin dioxygenase-like cupin family protein
MWRLATLSLLFAGAGYAAFFYEVELRVVNVTARGREMVRADPTNPSLNDTFYSTDNASVHMHVLGPDEVCQLHFHQENDEATLIAAGLAHVTTRFGRNGSPESLDEVYSEGTLIGIPRFCGHRWHNVTPQTFHTNLVFSRPTFTFNDFVRPDDARLLRAGSPSIVDLRQRLSHFVAEGEPSRDETLSALGGTMHAVFVRDSYALLAAGREPATLYVVDGEGELDAGRTAHLVPGDLAIIAHAKGARLRAKPGAPMASLLFYPERR